MMNARRQTILIVDDEPDVVRMLSGFLTKEGFDVLAAKSGPEGVETAKFHEVDLVVMDIAMPEMDGIDAYNAMKQARPGLPAVFMTAHRSARVAEVYGMGPSVGCIFKPFDLNALKAVIDAKLKGW